MFVRGRDNNEHNHPYLKPHANIQLENCALFAKMEAFAKWAKTLEAKKPWKPPTARHGKFFLRNLRTLTRANLKRKCIPKMKKITQEKAKFISKKVKVF